MLDKVKEWLDRMQLSYAFNKERRVFLLPYDIDGVKFSVLIIVFPEKWIKIAALILEKDKVNESVYKTLLKANWDLFEVTYSLDPEGNVVSENDITFDSNFENFQSEFNAVVFGVVHFFVNRFNELRKHCFCRKTKVGIYKS